MQFLHARKTFCPAGPLCPGNTCTGTTAVKCCSAEPPGAHGGPGPSVSVIAVMSASSRWAGHTRRALTSPRPPCHGLVRLILGLMSTSLWGLGDNAVPHRFTDAWTLPLVVIGTNACMGRWVHAQRDMYVSLRFVFPSWYLGPVLLQAAGCN